MNEDALRHIENGVAYLTRGEGWYRKAAEEFEAARTAGATWPEINGKIGRGAEYAERIVRWAKTPANEAARAPFGGEKENARKAAGHTKTVLRDAPMEQVEQIIDELPKERQQAIAAAAGHSYLAARQQQDEADRQRTPHEQRDVHDTRENLSRPVRQATAGFTSLGIIGHLEQATDELRELTADASLTPTVMRKIERADDAWREALNFARALVGEEGDR